MSPTSVSPMHLPTVSLRASGAALLLAFASALLPGPASAQIAPIAPAGPSDPSGPPNVVVLFVDDLGYGDLGSYGSPDALTPHLDDLAARGLRFTDFYSGAPICTPSRYALLTSLHPFRNGDPDLLGPLHPSNTDSGIDAEAVTLAEALRDGGYETAMIGKWHLGHGEFVEGGAPDTEFHPLHHGFDSFFGSVRGGIDYNTHHYRDDFLDWWEDRRPVPEDSLRYATHVFGERAAAFVEERVGAGITRPPFFLYLPFNAPHYGQTPELDARSRMQLPIGEEREYLSRFDHLYPSDDDIRKRYLAMVAVLDDEVGRLVDALDRAGLMERTVFWFLSDNGGTPTYGGSNGPLRGNKRDPYEGGIRVPSFVVWPGQIPPGTSDQVIGSIDIFPTVLAMAGLRVEHAVDGTDVSDHLYDRLPLRRGVAVPNAWLGDAYRIGPWKLVRHYDDDGEPLPPELYDLDVDPGETRDLASLAPDVVADLEARLPYDRPPAVQPPREIRGGVGALPTGASDGTVHAHPRLVLPTSPALRVLPNPVVAGAPAAIEVVVPEAGPVRVEAFDALGRRLAVLHDGRLAAGTYRMPLPPAAPGALMVRATGSFGTLTATATRLR